MSVKTISFGLPRNSFNDIIPNTVKKFLEEEISEDIVLKECVSFREQAWKLQQKLGIDFIASNDFTLFDHVLDTTCMLGNIPSRYYWEGGKIPLSIYFTMIYGAQKDKFDVSPLENSQYFNTSYSYLVPEMGDSMQLMYSDNKPILEFLEGKSKGISTTPNILGMMTYLHLSKSKDGNNVLDNFEETLHVYETLAINLKRIDVKSICFYEPLLCQDLTSYQKELYLECYNHLRNILQGIEIQIATFYGNISHNFHFLHTMPIDTIHFDATRLSDLQIDQCVEGIRDNMKYSLGLVDSNSIWINDIQNSVKIANRFITNTSSDRIYIGTSAPLFQGPYDITQETNIPKDMKNVFSCAVQKLEEVVLIRDILNNKSTAKTKLNQNIANITQLKSLINNNNYNKNHSIKPISQKTTAKTIKKQSTKSSILNHVTLGYFHINEASYNAILNPSNEKSRNILASEMKKIIDLQLKYNINMPSCGEIDRFNDYDLYSNAFEGILQLQNNCITTRGDETIPVSIIYDYPKHKKNMFDVELFSKLVNLFSDKQLKISLLGPCGFVNTSSCHPNINPEILKQILGYLVSEEMLKISKMNFCLDESMILVNQDTSKITKNQSITLFVELANGIIQKLTQDNRKISYYFKNIDIQSIIEDIDRIEAFLIMFESANSQHEVCDTLIGYKNLNDFAVGCFQNGTARKISQQEVAKSLKKLLRVISPEQLSIMVDYKMNYDNMDDISKALNIINTTINSVKKTIKQ